MRRRLSLFRGKRSETHAVASRGDLFLRTTCVLFFSSPNTFALAILLFPPYGAMVCICCRSLRGLVTDQERLGWNQWHVSLPQTNM